MIHDAAGWIKASIAAAFAAAGVVYIAGGDIATLRTSLTAAQGEIATVTAEHKVDHDTVIELRTQLRDIDERTKEIQSDVKTLLGESKNDRSKADEKSRTR